ncbi:hypothetical protein CAPTEDRAFT_162715 [Capitella teleta]|uniref:Deacetylase sirtuin-type domain-containing protein n=1 Tax=Capitella teleta TaxID=283909 RepID=R7T6P1_CAPTE|nr:hypothetical protein CAPTEDRAFT_162715 [Capitella teleta]|eukprot:ELT89185.1 hypothetical protein CAPTEDRAFT_162715 [Capitella teleta]
MTGAGISTGSGIPDFRTPGTGLYDNLQQYSIPQPQAIFDRNYFEGNPRPFLTLAKELYPGKYQPNSIHYFLRLLHEKGLLLRVYTQNIDGLERMAGIPPLKIVEAHGSFQTASCIRCRQPHSPDEIKSAIMSGSIPRCRRSGCLGLVKPDIVFFGEDLPKRFFYYLKDFPQADLLIVMGTSLEVEPFAEIVDSVRHYIPRILFNRVAVGPFRVRRRMNDVCSLGDLDTNVTYFAKMLGWSADLKNLIKKHQESEPKATKPLSCAPSIVSTASLEKDLSKLSLHITPKESTETRLASTTHNVSTGSHSAGGKLLSNGRPTIPVHRNPPRYGNNAWSNPVSFHAQKHLYRMTKTAASGSEEELFAHEETSDETSSGEDEED